MDVKELKKIIREAQKAGIAYLKIDGVEMKFDDRAIKIPKSSVPDAPEVKLSPEEQAKAQMNALMWSVQSLDPLKEQNG